MPHKDANHEPAIGPEVEPEVQPAASSAPGPQRGMAKVLERVLAPDLVPPVVRLGDTQMDTATYIGELAGVARHQGPRAATDAAYAWIMPQDMPQET